VVSTRAPTQSAPPLAGAGLLHCRVLDWTPPPHFAVQAEYAPQAENPPFTAAGLQAGAATAGAQAVAAAAAGAGAAAAHGSTLAAVAGAHGAATAAGAGAAAAGAAHGAAAGAAGAGAAAQGAAAAAGAAAGAAAAAAAQGAAAGAAATGAAHGAAAGAATAAAGAAAAHGAAAGAAAGAGAAAAHGVGQAAVPHAWVSVAGPTQAAPPLAGAGLLHCLLRDIVPPPHVAEQALHAQKAPYPPFTGHAAVPHTWVSVAGPTQAAPPLAGAGLLHCLLRDIVPPPHVAEQALHAQKAPYPPFTGQAAVPHTWVSVAGPAQAAPPLAGAGLSQTRDRDIVPPPHVAVHALHAPNAP